MMPSKWLGSWVSSSSVTANSPFALSSTGCATVRAASKRAPGTGWAPRQAKPQEQAPLVGLHRRDANFANQLVRLKYCTPKARVEIIQRHDTLTPATDQHEFRAQRR